MPQHEVLLPRFAQRRPLRCLSIKIAMLFETKAAAICGPAKAVGLLCVYVRA